MIDIFEHPENFIVEGIGTIADILSGDIYEGVEYPLEIMAKLQQNCKTNFDGTRMQKSIELLEKTENRIERDILGKSQTEEKLK